MLHLDKKDMEIQCAEVSEILKALAHPTRLMILCFLAEKEHSVGDLIKQVRISQSLMSQFLGRMKEEGLLNSKRKGRSVVYHIQDPRIFKLLTSFKDVFCP